MANNHQQFYGRDASDKIREVSSLNGSDKLYNFLEKLAERFERLEERISWPSTHVEASMAIVSTSCDILLFSYASSSLMIALLLWRMFRPCSLMQDLHIKSMILTPKSRIRDGETIPTSSGSEETTTMPLIHFNFNKAITINKQSLILTLMDIGRIIMLIKGLNKTLFLKTLSKMISLMILRKLLMSLKVNNLLPLLLTRNL